MTQAVVRHQASRCSQAPLRPLPSSVGAPEESEASPSRFTRSARVLSPAPARRGGLVNGAAPQQAERAGKLGPSSAWAVGGHRAVARVGIPSSVTALLRSQGISESGGGHRSWCEWGGDWGFPDADLSEPHL